VLVGWDYIRDENKNFAWGRQRGSSQLTRVSCPTSQQEAHPDRVHTSWYSRVRCV